MSYEDYPTAPRLKTAYQQTEPREIETEPIRPTPDDPDPYSHPIHHHDLSTRELTPGGSLEQSVHTQLSGSARREINERLQAHEQSRESSEPAHLLGEYPEAEGRQEPDETGAVPLSQQGEPDQGLEASGAFNSNATDKDTRPQATDERAPNGDARQAEEHLVERLLEEDRQRQRDRYSERTPEEEAEIDRLVDEAYGAEMADAERDFSMPERDASPVDELSYHEKYSGVPDSGQTREDLRAAIEEIEHGWGSDQVEGGHEPDDDR